jgi:hypothetical protein
MSKFTKIVQTVPDINRCFVLGNENYSLPNIKAGNMKTINKINSNYGQIIEKWSDVFQIDKEVIIAFIATESSGNNVSPKPNFGPVGLMQISVAPVSESIVKFKQVTNFTLPSEAINYLNKVASFLTKLKSEILSNQNKERVRNLLTDPEFNIFCGIMHIRWLLEKYEFLNKTVVAYNTSAYNQNLKIYGKNKVETSVLVNNKKFPLETRSYLLKFLGRDGFLDLILTGNQL